MVFDANSAPRERAEFVDWYDQQAEWSEGHTYIDSEVTTEGLRNWYNEIRKTYPNMNGPDAPSDDDLLEPGVEDRLADYSIGKSMIYAGFAWSKAEEVYPLFRELAVKHKVGFYDVSGDNGDGEIYFPGDTLREPSEGAWRQISRDFQSGDLSKYIPQEEPQERRWWDIFRRNK